MSLQPELEPQMARSSIAIVLAAILGLSAAHAGDCTSSGEAAEAAAIRAERQAFNRAIAGKDLARIATVLQANVVLVTGTASEVYEGREAQLALWRGDFDSANRAFYARTTACVRVSASAPVALEIGRWRGQRDSAGDFAAGSYAAKWRRVDRTWTLEAEIYSTETCGGDFCPATAAATQ